MEPVALLYRQNTVQSIADLIGNKHIQLVHHREADAGTLDRGGGIAHMDHHCQQHHQRHRRTGHTDDQRQDPQKDPKEHLPQAGFLFLLQEFCHNALLMP